jgi:fatty-acyl-CoA synthase
MLVLTQRQPLTIASLLTDAALHHGEAEIVAEAAVIAAKHPKWDELPLLLVVAKPGHYPEPQALLNWYRERVAPWQMPDAALVVAALPHTATGKLLKTALRERYATYLLDRT